VPAAAAPPAFATLTRPLDGPFAAILLAVHDDRIHRVFFHGDLDRLRHLGG